MYYLTAIRFNGKDDNGRQKTGHLSELNDVKSTGRRELTHPVLLKRRRYSLLQQTQTKIQLLTSAALTVSFSRTPKLGPPSSRQWTVSQRSGLQPSRRSEYPVEPGDHPVIELEQFLRRRVDLVVARIRELVKLLVCMLHLLGRRPAGFGRRGGSVCLAICRSRRSPCHPAMSTVSCTSGVLVELLFPLLRIHPLEHHALIKFREESCLSKVGTNICSASKRFEMYFVVCVMVCLLTPLYDHFPGTVRQFPGPLLQRSGACKTANKIQQPPFQLEPYPECSIGKCTRSYQQPESSSDTEIYQKPIPETNLIPSCPTLNKCPRSHHPSTRTPTVLPFNSTCRPTSDLPAAQLDRSSRRRLSFHNRPP